VVDLTVTLGPLELRSPLIAASGTVGSVVDFAAVGSLESYGAAVAKSVSADPWSGRSVPRMAPAGVGMLNGIGIQNPGIGAWAAQVADQIPALGVPVWGSAVGESVEEFALVAKGLEAAGVQAVEVNLSCPNLESGSMFALDPEASGRVVASVRSAVGIPVGAKLSPNADSIVAVASAAADAGADWVVLTNTVTGFGIDPETRRPLLSGGAGGYSGLPIKPIVMRCVWEVHQAIPSLPIVGCGGVSGGIDVVEYLMAGASAVALGTVHFAEPRAGKRVLRELERWCRAHDVGRVSDLSGTGLSW
jgi:dihydroorotate dehydrogenase (NAD+) catalytic subunit